MDPSRRRLLQVGLGGAAVLALGGVGLALQPTAMRAAPGPLQVLSEREHAILAALAEAILPPREGLPTTDEVQVAFKLDKLMATLHPGAATEFQQGLMLMENGLAGLLIDGRIRPMSTLSLEARTRAVDGWRRSRIPLKRKVYKAVAGLVGATYWADPRTYAFVGYPGPPEWLLQLRDAPVPPPEQEDEEGADGG